MKIQLEKYRAHNIVKNISEKTGLETHEDCLELAMPLKEQFGKGRMISFKLSNGISFMMFNGTLEEDLVIQMPPKVYQPITFSYVVKGAMSHQLVNDEILYSLEPLQSSISTNQYKKKQLFCIEANVPQSIVLVMVNRDHYFDKVDCYIKDMPPKMQDIFNDKKSENKFLYEANYSTRISDIISEIKNDLNKDIVRSTFVEGKILELISYSIRQFRDDNEVDRKQILLRQADVDKIQIAKQILEKELLSPPTIKQLSKRIGVNQNKLKYAFKEMYDSTIRTYIINRRLDIARVMMLSGDKKLAEIAKEVGYSNYGHFSRIFKRRYDLLPKEYSRHTSQRISFTIGDEDDD